MRVVVLLSFMFIPSCVIVVSDVDRGPPGFGPDDACPRECINPVDESCWHEPGSCGDDADFDDDGVMGRDEVDLGTDPADADSDDDGDDDGSELQCASDPLDAAVRCP
jgi:hypothetical protein